MAIPSHIYITEAAYQTIHTELDRVRGAETGGILVGRLFNLTDHALLAVVAASGPGDAAHLQRTSYIPDTVAHQLELEYWRARYAAYQIDYLGEWHSHPAGLDRPSLGDTQQVAAILADPHYNLPAGMLTPIVTYAAGSWRMQCYYYPRLTGQPMLLPWECFTGSGDQLLAACVGYERGG